MTDDDKVVDNSDSVPAPCAPCNKCAFTYHKQTREHERDIYRGGREHPRCAWHIGGVPVDILKCKKECPRYTEKKVIEEQTLLATSVYRLKTTLKKAQVLRRSGHELKHTVLRRVSSKQR